MTKNTIIIRCLVDVLVFFLIINAWWIPALLIVTVCAWLFRDYFELVIAGVIFDALFGMTDALGISGYVGTIISVGVFFAIYFLKMMIRK